MLGDDSNVYYCTNNLNQYTTTDDTTTCPPSTPTESFAYDTDGNLTGDGGKVPGASRPDGTPRKFTWDAENRLIRVEPADGYAPVSGELKVEFRYDYMGRRVEKKVSTLSGSSWAVTDTRRFLWYNWLMLLELNGSNEVLKKYTWGLDLAGLSGQVNSLESAGGIGGLLACYDTAGTSGTGDDKSYAYLFDANGNVGQLIDVSDGSLDAHYEYDAYGNAVVAIGSYGQSNALRFSTKYWDDETGLGNWGLRYAKDYIWLCRDPLFANDMNRSYQEPVMVGRHPPLSDLGQLYRMLSAAPPNHYDAIGLSVGSCCYRPTSWKVCCTSLGPDFNALDNLVVRHCDLRNTPCLGGVEYPVWIDKRCSRSLATGGACCCTSEWEIDSCLDTYPYAAFPFGPNVGDKCGKGRWGNNCQTNTMIRLAKCCLVTFWRPNSYAGPHDVVCVKGHYETRAVFHGVSVYEYQVWICDAWMPLPFWKRFPEYPHPFCVGGGI